MLSSVSPSRPLRVGSYNTTCSQHTTCSHAPSFFCLALVLFSSFNADGPKDGLIFNGAWLHAPCTAAPAGGSWNARLHKCLTDLRPTRASFVMFLHKFPAGFTADASGAPVRRPAGAHSVLGRWEHGPSQSTRGAKAKMGARDRRAAEREARGHVFRG